MLPVTIVLEIQRLLSSGAWSQRKIAEMLGVSRGTVSAVAQGRRTPDDNDCDSDIEVRGFKHPRGTPRRCARCGVLTKMPCLSCQIAEWELRNPRR